MRNFKQLFLFVLLIRATSYLAISQTQNVQDHIKKMMPTPVPQAPNVASLGKYGEYQVSHFTGVPDISIPIYEVKSGSLSIPITLSYHASGVKPTDVASWVGMGWSLSAGGEVARQVQGKPDEQYYYSNLLKQNPSVCGPAGTGTFYYLKNEATNVIDTEPDIFSYSFPGKGGKFILPNGSAPILFPSAPLVINTTAAFGKFEIRDDQGVLHRFGQNAAATQYAQDYTYATNGGNPTVSATTAWHLMEMVAPNSNDLITLGYQSLGASTTHDISYSYAVMDQCYAANGGSCPLPYAVLQQSNNDSNINQVGLQTITFETGKVVFELSTSNRSDVATLKRLERIKIYSTVNGVDILQKTIKFNYSYFTNAIGGNQSLKLDGVQFLDKTDNAVQNYTFNYFTNSFSWTPNATNFLNARDLWGYYNGATSNTDLILPQTIPFNQTVGSSTTNLSFGGALNRTVNTLYIKEGVLKRINFPTGGYTEFDFESNKYDKSGVTTNAGGLRVTSITSSDGSALPPIVKTYKYGIAESGLGIPNFLDTDFNYSSTVMVYSDCEVTSPITNYQARTFFSQTIGQESPIMYPQVTEYLGNPTGATNGKTIYVYDNGSPVYDAPNTMPGSTKKSKNSYAWKRGKLTSKTVYSNSNQIISSSSISHTLYNTANNLVGLSVFQFISGNYSPICSGNSCTNELGELVNAQTFFFGSMYQSSGVLMETNSTETIYENGDFNKYVTKSSSSQFDPTYLQVTQSIQSGALTGESLITKLKYPFNYTFTGSETSTALGVKMLKDKNILATPIEQYTIKQVGSTNNVIGGQVTTFKPNPGNTNYVSSDVVYLLETGTAIPEASYVTSGINSSAVTMDNRYKPGLSTFQDLNGNLLQVQQTNNMCIGYQWGYNNSLPIAEVQNAQNNKHIVYSQVTGISTIAMGGPTPSVVLNKTIIVTHPGTVYLKLGVGGNPAYTTRASYSSATLGNASNITLSKNVSCGAAPIIATFTNVSAGSHTITITLTTPDSGIPSIGACGQLDFPDVAGTPSGITEFFYENFEEGSATGVANPHTGKKYLLGAYTTTFVKPNARNYVIEYWYLSGSIWIYASTAYTNGMILNSGTAIDDVRIYPTDARMKSYVYEPGLGISSVIDENGTILYYNYDTFGRLSYIKNDKGEIEKQYSYNYKN